MTGPSGDRLPGDRLPGDRLPEPPAETGQAAQEELRSLRAADLPVLAELHARCFPSEPWSSDELALLLAQPGVAGFLAERAGQALGFLLLRRAADEAEVLTLGVEAGSRRQGIARRLVAFGLERLAPPVRQVFLEVAVENRAAIALYRELRFRAVGKRENYYKTGGDALVLRRDLAQISG